MATIKTPEDLPDWFDIERYELEPTGSEAFDTAALAVLDRIPFYQSITAQSFNLPTLDRNIRDAALSALREWSADPYQCITDQWKGALQAALQPSVSDDDIAAFESILEREDDAERVASQRELMGVVESASHLPPEAQRMEVVAEIQRLQEKEDEEVRQVLRDATGREDGLKPKPHAWQEKLITYRIAAYLDLTLWAPLAGHTLNVGKLQGELSPDGPDPRSVTDLLKGLREFQHLQYRKTIQEGRAFHSSQKNRSQRK